MEYAELTWDHDENAHQLFLEHLAPIVLFTYNRLEHTCQTVENLQKNIYAINSHLIVYSDGAKNEAAEEKVAAVRAYLHAIQGFKSVEIIERSENWGLARNIIDGVTNIVNKYGKIIVLEDDIVTSKWFLKYMNDALEVYKDTKIVLQIGGYTHPICKEGLEETFFVQKTDCWGWGIWKERWALFERNPEEVMKSFTKQDIYKFNMDGAFDFWNQVKENYDGKLFTWAIFLQIVGFRRKTLTLYPKISMTKNCGMDSSGEHCDETNVYEVKVAEGPVKHFSKKIKDNPLAERYMHEWFHRLNGSLWKRSLRKVKNIIMR